MTLNTGKPIEVFYSYSHIDEALRDQLENHLITLKRDGVIESWHDRRIEAGTEWEGDIDEHLNSADIILLLVSSDFLASKYCYDVEVKRSIERHEAAEARVIPVILRSCDWQTAPFGKLQALPKNALPVKKWLDQDDAFVDIVRGIRKAANEIKSSRQLSSPTSSVETPNHHLSPQIPNYLIVDFVARRDKDGHDIVTRLKNELAPQMNRLIVLWGAGGVGKTSLAAETARALIEAYEQRIVWVSADGRKDFTLSMLLDEIADQLGYNELRSLALEPKKEQLRNALAGAPAFIVLDNFETIAPEQQQLCTNWLSQIPLGSALITTRQKIDKVRDIRIGAMSPEEAHAFLQLLIAPLPVPNAFANLDHQQIIRTAEANPLVLQWVVAQIELAQDPQDVLDELAHGGGDAAERVFEHSLNLPQLGADGRDVMLAISLFVPSAARQMLAEVAGLGEEKK